MRWAFQGIVLPALTYGCIVWGTRLVKYETKLRRLNRMAINSISHIPKSSPTRAVELLTGLKPVHLIIKENALKAYVRNAKSIECSEWDGLHKQKKDWIGHRKCWERELELVGDLSNQDYNLGPQNTNKFNINL
jgi:hypothetical protein